MVEALRVPSRDGVALLSEDEATQAQAVASADAVLLVARACLRACPQVLQMQQTPQVRQVRAMGSASAWEKGWSAGDGAHSTTHGFCCCS